MIYGSLYCWLKVGKDGCLDKILKRHWGVLQSMSRLLKYLSPILCKSASSPTLLDFSSKNVTTGGTQDRSVNLIHGKIMF